nr:hypothetical protein [Bacteroidota bacterium]
MIDPRDGQSYNTIQISTQCWMAENLNIGTRINGGEPMVNNSMIEKYCFDNNPVNCETYGGMYQWNEIMQYTTQQGSQGICIDGWHIPADNEWQYLVDFLGGDGAAGSKVKETGTLNWLSPNTGATNESGFTALPGGRHTLSNSFYYLGTHADFWSSTTIGNDIWVRSAYHNNDNIGRNNGSKPSGFSVRCLNDNVLTSDPPEVDLGKDITTCEGDSYNIEDAIASSYSAISWTTSGNGMFDDPSSLNPTYAPGNTDLTQGFSTLILTAYPIPPATQTASDQMTLTYQFLPETNAGEDATIIQGETYSLSDASAVNYYSISWTTSGSGAFSNPGIPNPVYTPSTEDISSGLVQLTLFCSPLSPCVISFEDIMLLTIEVLYPTANAGSNATICEDDSYTLSDASSTNYSAVSWTASGDGVFDNPTLVDPTYNPGNSDISQGFSILTLTAYPIAPATQMATDQMTMTYQSLPEANAGQDKTICEGDSYTLSDATVDSYSFIEWTYSGDGSFADSLLVNATYTPGMSDVIDGTVKLILTAHSFNPCAGFVSDTMTLTIQLLPLVEAGQDAIICENESYTLGGIASDYSAALWTTNGDGTFDDATLLDAVYTPGEDDIANGLITLSLTATASDPCADDFTDDMVLTVYP